MKTGIAWAHEQRPETQIRADQCTFFDINIACVASVSVRFRREKRGTRVKDRAKNAASKRSIKVVRVYFETCCETHFNAVAVASVASFLLLTLLSVSWLSLIVYYIHKPLKGVFCYEDCNPGIVLYITPRIVTQCHLLGSKAIFNSF